MTKEKKILQMYYDGHSQRDICAALSLGHSTVNRLIASARDSEFGEEALMELEDADIVRLFTPPHTTDEQSYAKPDFVRLTKELEKPHVTRKLLWYEYCNSISEKSLMPYKYAQFCRLFEEHLEVSKATYKINHKPAQRMFVDWAGTTAHIIDAVTGAEMNVYVFVASLPYSAMIYAEGFMDMKQASWTDAHIHAFKYFGGVPSILVPDNTKTAIIRTQPRESVINEAYEALSVHYGCAIIPARVRRPNDKALVENGVNIVSKSVLAAIRNEKFFTLSELNDEIFRRVDLINAAPFQRRPGSRREIFETEEKEHLSPMPEEPFENPSYKKAKVAPDYHVQFDTMRYSVPYKLIAKSIELRITTSRVDVFYDGRMVATHKRLYGRKGQYSTLGEHMPARHAAYDASWSPERYQAWADQIGPFTRAVIDRILASKVIVEQAFVPCMNVLGLAKNGRRNLLEASCESVIKKDAMPTYSLLKHTMQAMQSAKRLSEVSMPAYTGNEDKLGEVGLVRGASYYSSKGGDK